MMNAYLLLDELLVRAHKELKEEQARLQSLEEYEKDLAADVAILTKNNEGAVYRKCKPYE